MTKAESMLIKQASLIGARKQPGGPGVLTAQPEYAPFTGLLGEGAAQHIQDLKEGPGGYWGGVKRRGRRLSNLLNIPRDMILAQIAPNPERDEALNQFLER